MSFQCVYPAVLVVCFYGEYIGELLLCYGEFVEQVKSLLLLLQFPLFSTYCVKEGELVYIFVRIYSSANWVREET